MAWVPLLPQLPLKEGLPVHYGGVKCRLLEIQGELSSVEHRFKDKVHTSGLNIDIEEPNGWEYALSIAGEHDKRLMQSKNSLYGVSLGPRLMQQLRSEVGVDVSERRHLLCPLLALVLHWQERCGADFGRRDG